jgi:hypothetical protein
LLSLQEHISEKSIISTKSKFGAPVFIKCILNIAEVREIIKP